MPTPEEVQQMSNLTNLLDDIDSGRPVRAQKPLNNTPAAKLHADNMELLDNSPNVSAMANIMASLDDAADLYDGTQKQKAQAQYQYVDDNPTLPVDASDSDIYSILSAELQQQSTSSATPIHQQQQQHQPTTHSVEFVVVTESYKGSNTFKQYQIKSNYSGTIIADNLLMKESAYALANMLNDKTPVTDNRCIGILSMGLQYTQLFEGTFKHITKRQRVLKECNYAEAAEADKHIRSGKLKADTIKSDLLLFLTKEGIRYK